MVNSKVIDSAREYIAGFEEGTVAHLGFNEEDMEVIGDFKSNIVTFLTSLLEGEIEMEIIQRMTKSLDFKVLKQRVTVIFRQFAIKELDAPEDLAYSDIPLAKLMNCLKADSFESIIKEAF